MNLLFQLMVNAMATVLYFDGSLCHPVDTTFPTFKQKQRASCAAYICLKDGSREFLGGRILSCSSLTTSAEVEYEALILGLEGLQQVLREIPLATFESDVFPVTVRGDCKMVLQQMSGGSRPRKMESFYNRASRVVDDIQTHNPTVQISFQHIPRTQNIISDRLCSEMLAKKQYIDETAALVSLSNLSCNAACLDFINAHLREDSNALIYSRRSNVYRFLSQLAFCNQEWTTLTEIGERWSHELQNVWPRNNNELRDHLFVEALTIQLVGLQALDKRKELAFRRRTHQYLLSIHAQISKTVEGELSRVPASPGGSIIISPERLKLDNDECPLLIERWIQEAASTSIWTNNNAYWINGSEINVVSNNRLE